MNKDVDRDSRFMLKAIENQGWWKPDISRHLLNITLELLFERFCLVKQAVYPTLQGKHMMVC